MPVRYAIERGAWDEAVTIPPKPGSSPQVLAITYWSHAIGLARSGKIDAAAIETEKLSASLRAVRERNDDYWAAQVEIQIDEAKAWIAHAKGQRTESVSLLHAAAEKEGSLEKRPITPGPIVPAREQLGDLLLEQNQPGEALREFETSLVNAPGRRRGLSGAARAAELAGDSAKAEQFKKQLRVLGRSKLPTGLAGCRVSLGKIEIGEVGFLCRRSRPKHENVAALFGRMRPVCLAGLDMQRRARQVLLAFVDEVSFDDVEHLGDMLVNMHRDDRGGLHNQVQHDRPERVIFVANCQRDVSLVRETGSGQP